ncbi:type II secretion system protein GspD [Ideonella paludis]|uniref:type II secretion system protein GspD n=1 Tax=Ideonella paludis TaxID=1233411 RepID=UPI00364060E0
MLVGDKVPVVTTTTGQGGFVADSVNYLDVGLKLEVEPTIFADDEVAIKVGLEVSSVSREVRSTNGTLAYQIGTRNANTTLRLRDGETQLLAGLISREERISASRLPGLGDLPVAGRLFSSQRDDNTKTELVLAVTPASCATCASQMLPRPSCGWAQNRPPGCGPWVGAHRRLRRPPAQTSRPLRPLLRQAGLKGRGHFPNSRPWRAFASATGARP